MQLRAATPKLGGGIAASAGRRRPVTALATLRTPTVRAPAQRGSSAATPAPATPSTPAMLMSCDDAPCLVTYDEDDTLTGADARAALRRPDVFRCLDDVPCHATYSEEDAE